MKIGVEQASKSRKIYKFTMARQTVAANNRAVLTASYVSDDLFYLDNNVIKSRYTGTILVNAHVIGAPQNTNNRLWCVIGGVNQIVYGVYCNADPSDIKLVDTGFALACNFIEGFEIGSGGTGEGYITITILD